MIFKFFNFDLKAEFSVVSSCQFQSLFQVKYEYDFY